MQTKTIALILLLVSSSIISYSQQKDIPSQNQQEIQFLRHQFDSLSQIVSANQLQAQKSESHIDFYSSMLDNVIWWSTIILGLFGVVTFFNFDNKIKNQKEQIEKYKQNNQDIFSNFKASLNTQLQNQLTTLTETKAEFLKIFNKNEIIINEKLIDFKENMRELIDNRNTEQEKYFDRRINSETTNLSTLINQQLQTLSSEFDGLNKVSNHINYTIAGNMAEFNMHLAFDQEKPELYFDAAFWGVQKAFFGSKLFGAKQVIADLKTLNEEVLSLIIESIEDEIIKETKQPRFELANQLLSELKQLTIAQNDDELIALIQSTKNSLNESWYRT